MLSCRLIPTRQSLRWSLACRVFIKQCRRSAHGKAGKETGWVEGEAELKFSPLTALTDCTADPERTPELSRIGLRCPSLDHTWASHQSAIGCWPPQGVHDLNRGGSCIPDNSTSATGATCPPLTDLSSSSQLMQIFFIFCLTTLTFIPFKIPQRHNMVIKCYNKLYINRVCIIHQIKHSQLNNTKFISWLLWVTFNNKCILYFFF